MMQLQLRTPQPMRIEDLIAKLALTILESVKRELDSMEVPFESYRTLEGQIVTGMSPYLKAYDRCGKDPICTEGIKGIPLHASTDRIYMLLLPEGVDNLLDSISENALESIHLFLDKDAADALDRRVKSSLHRVLGEHIYRNSFCGKHDICKLSSPVNPWIVDSSILQA